MALTRPLRQSVLRPHESLQELAGGEADGTYAAGVFDGAATDRRRADRAEPRARRLAGGRHGHAPDARGRGAGGAVLDACCVPPARGALRVWCNARTPAQRFYERAGFA